MSFQSSPRSHVCSGSHMNTSCFASNKTNARFSYYYVHGHGIVPSLCPTQSETTNVRSRGSPALRSALEYALKRHCGHRPEEPTPRFKQYHMYFPEVYGRGKSQPTRNTPES